MKHYKVGCHAMHIYQCGEKATSRGVEYQCICLPNKEMFDKYAMLGIVSSVSMPWKTKFGAMHCFYYIFYRNQDSKVKGRKRNKKRAGYYVTV
jgi:hypothetical protein